MKKLSFVLVLLILSISLFSQIKFNDHLIFESTVLGTHRICLKDLDGDSDIDFLFCSFSLDKIGWFENDGFGNFTNSHIIEEYFPDPISISANDIDGDGDNDIIVSSQTSNYIAIYKNNGNGSFGSQQVITYLTENPVNSFAVDLDGDNDLYIISSSMVDNKIAWYKNNGLGSFGPQQLISDSLLWPFGLSVSDVDNDGDFDVVSGSILLGKIAWFENNGSGVFSNSQTITIQALEPRNIVATDLDGDGDSDVIYSSGQYYDIVAWYKNLGNGNWSSEQILCNNMKASEIVACDIDGDDDQDIVVNPYSSGDAIIWLQNDGNGNFSNSIPIDSINYCYGLACADLDNDGKKDIAVSQDPGYLLWYPQDSLDQFGQKNIITFALNFPKCACISDFNYDNTEDIIIGTKNTIVRFKNLGSGSFTFEDTIQKFIPGVIKIITNDFDGDGYKDLIAGTYATVDKIIWLRGDSLGNFSTQLIIADSLIGVRDLVTADLDNDGDIDVLYEGYIDTGGAYYDNVLSWWQNDGFGNFGQEIVILHSEDGFSGLDVADLDNDGDMDIVYASDSLFWCENLGNALSFQSYSILSFTQVRDVSVANINGDSLIDIVMTKKYGSNTGKIVSLINNGGGNFYPLSNFSTVLWSGHPIVITQDIDLDGDLDILTPHGPWPNSVIWFENDGIGNFSDEQILLDSIWSSFLLSADFDNDGDYDLLCNFFEKDKLYWAENLGYQTSDSDSICANEAYILSTQVATSPGI